MTADRRPLVAGLNSTHPDRQNVEQAFVYGESRAANHEATPSRNSAGAKPTESSDQPALLPQMYNRVPITTRARPELASALKRASLQRQLAGTEPFYVQDILEVAIETWLRQNGHLE